MKLLCASSFANKLIPSDMKFCFNYKKMILVITLLFINMYDQTCEIDGSDRLELNVI